ISGAVMCIRRARYHTLGGMDERYFFHVEDLDLCYFITKHGGKILFVPTIRCIHHRSSSDVPQSFIEQNKSRGFIQYFDKYFRHSFFPGVFVLLKIGIRFRLWLRLLGLRLRRKGTPAKKRVQKPGKTPLVAGSIASSTPTPAIVRASEKQKVVPLSPDILRRQLLEMPVAPFDLTIPESLQPVLLTGASGQVGLSILRYLLAQNVETIALYNQHAVLFSKSGLHWQKADLELPLSDDVFEHKPRTLIHTPSIWLLPPHLNKLSEKGIKRIVCFSSTSITSKSGSTNAAEQVAIRNMATAEESIARMCSSLNIDWTIFRPTLIYGIGLDRNVSSIVRFIRRFGFFPIYTHASGLRQPVHVDDLAWATVAALGNKETHSKTYVVSGGEALSYHQMVVRIFNTLGISPRVIRVPFLPTLLNIATFFYRSSEINGEVARRMNLDQSYPFDEAAADFGYAPRDFLTGGMEDLEPSLEHEEF
ncbi:MAG: hypothetical protein KDD76_07145, partial [Rickettsiales bacterium]|nr:hypothetical protein [Rickettsiales bacterium]